MRTINLDANTSSIEIKLAWAVTTNQLDWTCSWYDTTIADWTVLEWKTTWVTNDTTAVTVCAAPASWHTRTVKCITIYNADTVNATPIVQLNDNSSIRVIYRNTLTTLSSVSLDDMSIITDISWKVDWPASATNENIAVFDWTTWKLIKDWWATITSLQLSKASWSDVDTWTDDAKYVTSKAIEDSSYIKASWIPYANASETTTWTETAKSVTPDGLAWSVYWKRIIEIKLVDDATALTTWDWKVVMVIPEELNWYNLVWAHAMVSTVSSSWTPTYQIRNVTDSVDMLSTRITIDASEYTSYTAATAPVIDTTKDDVATWDRIAIDKDVAWTGEKWDTIILTFQLP